MLNNFKRSNIFDSNVFVNPFQATCLSLYPLKTEKQIFSDVFRGCRKRPVA